MELLERERGR